MSLKIKLKEYKNIINKISFGIYYFPHDTVLFIMAYVEDFKNPKTTFRSRDSNSDNEHFA